MHNESNCIMSTALGWAGYSHTDWTMSHSQQKHDISSRLNTDEYISYLDWWAGAWKHPSAHLWTRSLPDRSEVPTAWSYALAGGLVLLRIHLGWIQMHIWWEGRRNRQRDIKMSVHSRNSFTHTNVTEMRGVSGMKFRRYSNKVKWFTWLNIKRCIYLHNVSHLICSGNWATDWFAFHFYPNWLIVKHY